MGLFFGRDSTMPYALRGTLQGHNGAITSIATNRDTPDVLISASRDKTIISWTLNDTSSADDAAGVPKRSLLRWCLRFVLLLGSHSSSLGFEERCYHQDLRRPRQGCPLRCLLADNRQIVSAS